MFAQIKHTNSNTNTDAHRVVFPGICDWDSVDLIWLCFLLELDAAVIGSVTTVSLAHGSSRGTCDSGNCFSQTK